MAADREGDPCDPLSPLGGARTPRLGDHVTVGAPRRVRGPRGGRAERRARRRPHRACAAERRGARRRTVRGQRRGRRRSGLHAGRRGGRGRGVPTAARVTVAARAPLRPGVTEAQCGGPFAFGLAGLLDGLVISAGRRSPCTSSSGGRRSRAARHRADGESERGRARRSSTGERRSSSDPRRTPAFPSRTSPRSTERARRASSAAAVSAPRCARPGSCRSWSSKARERRGGRGGSPPRSAAPRGSSNARGAGPWSSPRSAARPAWSGGSATRHGCRGCPTPCGWVLQLEEEGTPRRAIGRFAAMQGFAASGEAGRCLDRCNQLGMDARSAARLVRDLGREAELPGVLEEFVEQGRPAHAAAVALGPSGDEEPADAVHEADLAARVGVIASPRGPEPMRSLSIFGLSPGVDLPGVAFTGDAAANAGAPRAVARRLRERRGHRRFLRLLGGGARRGRGARGRGARAGDLTDGGLGRPRRRRRVWPCSRRGSGICGSTRRSAEGAGAGTGSARATTRCAGRWRPTIAGSGPGDGRRPRRRGRRRVPLGMAKPRSA